MAARRRSKINPRSRKMYLREKKKGWRLLEKHRLGAADRRVVAKALGIVLENGVGAERGIGGSFQAVHDIMPILAADALAGVKGKISAEDARAWKKLLGWHCANQTHGFDKPCPSEVVGAAKGLSQKGCMALVSKVATNTWYGIRPTKEEREADKHKMQFSEAVEFQVRHDLFHTNALLILFLNRVQKMRRAKPL